MHFSRMQREDFPVVPLQESYAFSCGAAARDFPAGTGALHRVAGILPCHFSSIGAYPYFNTAKRKIAKILIFL